MRLLGRLLTLSVVLVASGVVACSSFAPAPDATDAGSDAPPAADGGGGADALAASDGAVPGLDAAKPCDPNAGRQCGDRFVFVTTEAYPGAFAQPGAGVALMAADGFCEGQAAERGEAAIHNRRWKAFLCTAPVNAIDRVGNVQARWIRPDGATLWPTTGDLKSFGPSSAIGSAGPVWTGCDAAGRTLPGLTCDDWTSAKLSGVYGLAQDPSLKWVSAGQETCADAMRLYCFEDAE